MQDNDKTKAGETAFSDCIELEAMPRETWPFLLATVTASIDCGASVEQALGFIKEVCKTLVAMATSKQQSEAAGTFNPNFPHSIIDDCMEICGHDSIGTALYHHGCGYDNFMKRARATPAEEIAQSILDKLLGLSDTGGGEGYAVFVDGKRIYPKDTDKEEGEDDGKV